MVELSFEVVQPRVPDGLGLYLRSRHSSHVYRIEPIRHYEQPRFWVLRVLRCQRPGVAVEELMPWVGNQQLTLAQLPEALGKIRENIDGWVAEEPQATLRLWFNDCESVNIVTIVDNEIATTVIEPVDDAAGLLADGINSLRTETVELGD